MLTATATATASAFRVQDILRAFANWLEVPVVVVLIFFLLSAAALLGWTVAEFFTERRHLKPELPKLLEQLRTADDPAAVIAASGLLRRQKQALLELTRHPDFTPVMRESLALRLLEQEQDRYDKIVKLSELLARLAPMFGLLGTLIPLGPGIIALGQGDTYTLSTSLLTAFDTTIAGLMAAAFATVISTVRRGWYREYGSILEACAQCLLEIEKGAGE
jgi:biopolymer transport protein ExbB/TolQ